MCLAAANAGSAAPAASTLPEPEQPAAEPSPLAQYRLSPEEQAYVWETWQFATHACMTGLGFEFDLAAYADVFAGEGEPRTPQTVADAELYGYGPLPMPQVVVVLENDQRAADDPAYHDAVFGPDDDDASDGCSGEAYQRVYDDQFGYNDLVSPVSEATSTADVEAETTQEFTALTANWAECMTNAGFPFDRPSQPLETYFGVGPTPEAVQTRIADLGCQAEVSYNLTRSQIANEIAARWMEENPQLLEDVNAAKAAYLTDLTTYRVEIGA